MNMLLWNVKGIDIKGKLRMVSDTCRNTATDIVCLMETKLSSPTLSALSELGNSFNFVVKNTASASGGIMIGAG